MATSPFTQAVVNSMRQLYPEVLADKSFDNTGLLLEAPFDPARRRANSVLLTIDLTRAVADEAIEGNHSVVVAYHPIIFRGLKSLTFADTQQSTLLRLATEGISVYCPHTAVDTVPGGMADWLCDIVTGKLDAPEPETQTAVAEVEPGSPDSATDVTTSEETSAASTKPTSPSPDTANPSDPFTSPPSSARERKPSSSTTQRTYSKPTYPNPQPFTSHTPLHPSTVSHTRTVVNPSPDADISAANDLLTNPSPSLPNPTFTSSNTGAGRLITFSTPQPLTHLIERIARGVGTPKGFPVAIPQQSTVEDHASIATVAVCPGAGGTVLRPVFHTADLIFTGELSHHEALAATERGGCVVSLFHSNSERGFLWSVMRAALARTLDAEWRAVRDKMVGELPALGRRGEAVEAVLNDESASVGVSERDRDPYGIVVLRGSEVEGVKI